MALQHTPLFAPIEGLHAYAKMLRSLLACEPGNFRFFCRHIQLSKALKFSRWWLHPMEGEIGVLRGLFIVPGVLSDQKNRYARSQPSLDSSQGDRGSNHNSGRDNRAPVRPSRSYRRCRIFGCTSADSPSALALEYGQSDRHKSRILRPCKRQPRGATLPLHCPCTSHSKNESL